MLATDPYLETTMAHGAGAQLLEAAERMREHAARVWVPFDYQVPPPEEDNWSLWLLVGGRGIGKRLALDTPIPTPTGWTTMGALQDGDQVLDDQGHPCTVTYVSPIAQGDSWRVVFNDGEAIIADAEHRWLTWDHAARKSAGRRVARGRGWPLPRTGPVVRTTAEIRATLSYGTRERNHAIHTAEPLVLPSVALPIPPYTLGVWLGDGNNRTGRITVGQGGEGVVEGMRADGYQVEPMKVQPERTPEYRVQGLTAQLRALGLLCNKHVPARYLRGSEDQRLALLMGLMDTDGGWDGSQAAFNSTTEALRDAVYELVVSLGMKATRAEKTGRLYGRACRQVYMVRFTPTMQVFQLAHKAAKVPFDHAQAQRRHFRYITAVEPVEAVPMRCIAVDSPSHLYLAGRGMIPTHNTDACAAYVNEQACKAKIRIAIIAPTLDDAIESCVNGVSGLKAHNPEIRMRYAGPGGTHVYWPNGSEAKLFGAHTPEDVDRLRAGGNRHLVWGEEIAAWRHLEEGWANMEFGLRLGAHPRVVASTTPKPRPFLKKLMDRATTRLARRAETNENIHLPEDRRRELYETWGGTRRGRQELQGIYEEDIEGALWQAFWIDNYRLTSAQLPMRERLVDRLTGQIVAEPALGRLVVAVDPAATHGEDSDETAYCVAAKGDDGRYYVLECDGMRLSPHGWASRVADAYERWQADRIIGEVNNGGDMVESTIRQVKGAIPFRKIVATRGKTLRAEPVAALYEQGKVSHVGVFAGLESQMTMFPLPQEHDDRVDAMVYAITELLSGGGGNIGFA